VEDGEVKIKLFQALKNIGGDLVKDSLPGKAVVGLVKAFVPEAETMTGDQLQEAIKALPPEQAAQIELAEIDLAKTEEEARTQRFLAMCQGDGQQTRAKLVNKAMNALIVFTSLFVAFIGWVYIEKGAADAFSYEMTAVFGIIVGPFVYAVRAYMGDLKAEAMSRHAAIDEKPKPGNAVAEIIKAKLLKGLM
jgi:hypothetical protein